MAIRQQIEWQGDNVSGFVDFGMHKNDPCTAKMAIETLVLMMVSLNGLWKLSVGYFFTSSLNDGDKSNLVNECLTLLHSVGIDVQSLNFDKSRTNIEMTLTLGCRLTL